MGDYIISDNVINSIAIHEAQKIDGLIKVQNINLRKTGHGVHIDMTVILQYGCDIFSVCKNIQLAVRNNVEQYTSINARRINILVKNLKEINFIFCNHPLYQRKVDEDYEDEYQEAGLHHSCALFSYETWKAVSCHCLEKRYLVLQFIVVE